MKPPPIKTTVLWNRANYLCRVAAEMKPSPLKTASLWLLLGGALLFVAINGKPAATTIYTPATPAATTTSATMTPDQVWARNVSIAEQSQREEDARDRAHAYDKRQRESTETIRSLERQRSASENQRKWDNRTSIYDGDRRMETFLKGQIDIERRRQRDDRR